MELPLIPKKERKKKGRKEGRKEMFCLITPIAPFEDALQWSYLSFQRKKERRKEGKKEGKKEGRKCFV